MARLNIISSVAESFGDGTVENTWILDGSAKRGMLEFRVETPWGYKLVEIEEFQLDEEMTPDAEQFRFSGKVGRFAVSGYVHSLAAEGELGELDVYACEDDEIELLTVFKKNQAMTPLEFMCGYPGMGED